ncbi:CLUMA_CG000679, isoform A [Clunio marinus]|uniref:Elongation of very long chain fatty acids protein n=1 Tax=Clunio marinus TaxID=568069 RepID=A0A1J1HFQ8_9DIPT|nr:CLUMA_CG000679, isoform A [Clunio marinus]
MDNFTDYDGVLSFPRNFVKMAVEEYNSPQQNWTDLIIRYWTVIDEKLGDRRVKHFPLMDTPIPTVAFILLYLSWVVVIGPLYMRDRKAHSLRNTLIYYNAFQVLLSAYMFYEHLMSGWMKGYSFTCETVDYSDGPQSRRMFNLCYVYYLSKLTEFADTVFFVLRKKKNQISWLHLYHHALTPIEAWMLVKFISGGNATFPNILNNFVHILMYFYYLLAALGPQYQKYLWWKRYMTELQIAQFVLCIFHNIRALYTGCAFPPFVSSLLLINSLIFFSLFMNFYIQNFYKKKTVAAKKVD